MASAIIRFESVPFCVVYAGVDGAPERMGDRFYRAVRGIQCPLHMLIGLGDAELINCVLGSNPSGFKLAPASPERHADHVYHVDECKGTITYQSADSEPYTVTLATFCNEAEAFKAKEWRDQVEADSEALPRLSRVCGDLGEQFTEFDPVVQFKSTFCDQWVYLTASEAERAIPILRMQSATRRDGTKLQAQEHNLALVIEQAVYDARMSANARAVREYGAELVMMVSERGE